jgi:hypothetical protein
MGFFLLGVGNLHTVGGAGAGDKRLAGLFL